MDCAGAGRTPMPRCAAAGVAKLHLDVIDQLKRAETLGELHTVELSRALGSDLAGESLRIPSLSRL